MLPILPILRGRGRRCQLRNPRDMSKRVRLCRKQRRWRFPGRPRYAEGRRRTTMTEAEWPACEDPLELFESLPAPVSRRKLLLFCVHCCFFDNREPNPDTATCENADLWRLTESFADGEVGEAEFFRAF